MTVIDLMCWPEKMKPTKYIVLFIFLCFAALICAKQALAEEKLGTFSLYFENDFFGDTDRYYTNGVKFSWISPDLSDYAESNKLPDWSIPYIRRLPFINEPGFKRNIGLSMGQKMYTPTDISRNELIEDDRPYAGWAYFGITLHSKNEYRLNSMEIQLGIIGPESFAEQTQKFAHKVLGCQQPNGWDNQLKNEPGLVIAYERKWRLLQAGTVGGLAFDAIPHLGGTLGNVYTYANAGMEARLGWNIPKDFGTYLIRPAGDFNPPVSTRELLPYGNRGFSLNIFAFVEGRAVLRDISLDGNTLTESHKVDKKHFVADVAVGVSLIIHRFKLTYARVLQTKEFKEQSDHQSFGSLSLSFSW